MKRVAKFVAGLISVAFTAVALAAAPTQTDLNFRVLLDGKPIGQHRFELRRDGDIQKVLSRADFNVRFLFVDVYRYHHTATERWRDGCLISLASRTDDDGTIETVEANRVGDAFTVEASGGREQYESCVRSFAYWNPKLLEGGHLLNAQTGEYLPVRLQSLGEDRIALNGRDEIAERYRLSGKDLHIDLWYTPDLQWLALESRIDSGRILRYERN